MYSVRRHWIRARLTSFFFLLFGCWFEKNEEWWHLSGPFFSCFYLTAVRCYDCTCRRKTRWKCELMIISLDGCWWLRSPAYSLRFCCDAGGNNVGTHQAGVHVWEHSHHCKEHQGVGDIFIVYSSARHYFSELLSSVAVRCWGNRCGEFCLGSQVWREVIRQLGRKWVYLILIFLPYKFLYLLGW